MQKFFLGIDQGSSSSKGILIDSEGEFLWHQAINVQTKAGAKGEIEQDGEELFSSVQELVNRAKSFAAESAAQISSIGLSCQRSCVVAWDVESKKAVHPVISWLDTRLSGVLAKFSGEKKLISAKAGLPLTVHYAGPKIAYLQERFAESNQMVSTLDTFLIWRLTGTFCTDSTMAARTMLYSLQSGSWDEQLCNVFGVTISRLPKIFPSVARRGEFNSIPIAASIGDAQAGCIAVSKLLKDPVLTLGTVASVMIPSAEKLIRRDGFISSVLKSTPLGTQYNLEGTNNSCGAIIDLIVNRKKFATEAKEIDSITRLEQQSKAEQGPIGYFPLGGMGPPHWQAEIGSFGEVGIEASAGTYVRAAFEHLAFAVSSLLLELRSTQGISFERIMVTGGVARSDCLLQMISDLTELELDRVEGDQGHFSASALGAAIVAAEEGGVTLQPKLVYKIARFTNNQHSASAASLRARFKLWKQIEEKILKGDTAQLVQLDLK